MDAVMAVALGVGLAAACGFRIFVPILVLGLAARLDQVALAPGFDWAASDLALVTWSVATVLEVAAYYVPWVDNMLDTVAGPSAVVAGVGVTAAVAVDMEPFAQWTLAVIAGGGAAASTQIGSTAVRAVSTLATGGIANPLWSTIEMMAAASLAILAVLFPLLAVGLLVGFIWIWRRSARKRASANA